MEKLTENINVRVSETLKRNLEQQAELDDLKTGHFVRRLILAGLGRQGKQCKTLCARRTG